MVTMLKPFTTIISLGKSIWFWFVLSPNQTEHQNLLHVITCFMVQITLVNLDCIYKTNYLKLGWIIPQPSFLQKFSQELLQYMHHFYHRLKIQTEISLFSQKKQFNFPLMPSPNFDRVFSKTKGKKSPLWRKNKCKQHEIFREPIPKLAVRAALFRWPSVALPPDCSACEVPSFGY